MVRNSISLSVKSMKSLWLYINTNNKTCPNANSWKESKWISRVTVRQVKGLIEKYQLSLYHSTLCMTQYLHDSTTNQILIHAWFLQQNIFCLTNWLNLRNVKEMTKARRNAFTKASTESTELCNIEINNSNFFFFYTHDEWNVDMKVYDFLNNRDKTFDLFKNTNWHD